MNKIDYESSRILTSSRGGKRRNSMLQTRLLILTALSITLFLPGVARAATSRCPSGGTPPPGSTVNGGLDVDGVCIVDKVTVNGGITVEAGGHLQLTSSTVNGGIVTLACGELDINATTLGAGVPTGTTSTINGGIDITAGAVCTTPGAFSNADIFTAHIDGGISITGTYTVFSFPFICGNTVKGSVDVNNVTGTLEGVIGDPDRNCPGNTITGTLHMTKSSVFAVESNTIGGSVLLSASTLELNGNMIGGSLRCSDGTVILPGEPSDPTGNTVKGKNTCS
jgi:hypothetical protein